MAQTYQPIFEEDKFWYIEAHVIDMGGGGEKIFTVEDTLINNFQYTPLISKFCDVFKTVGYIRTDSSNARVWYLQTTNDEEQLIMDLDLVVGDTFKIINQMLESEVATVIQIDTVDNRKVILLDKYREEECAWVNESLTQMKFIEGIGPSLIFSDLPRFELNNFCKTLSCVTQNDSVIYSLYSWPFCDFDCLNPTNTEEPNQNNSFSIQPNPTSDFLNIFFTKKKPSKNGQFKIIDISGHIIKSFEPEGFEATYTLPVYNMAKGIYFLQYWDGKELMHTEKFVVQ